MSAQEPPEGIEGEEAQGELVEALPAVVESRLVLPSVGPGGLPARQAARVAGVSFAAGAVASLVVSHQGRGWLRRRRQRSRGPLGQIAASRSFLVDVHLLRRD